MSLHTQDVGSAGVSTNYFMSPLFFPLPSPLLLLSSFISPFLPRLPGSSPFCFTEKVIAKLDAQRKAMRESDRERRSVSVMTTKSSLHAYLLDDSHCMTTIV